MTTNGLNPPNWPNLPGGSTEASWLADRNRKLGLILDISDSVLETAFALEQSHALFTPSADIMIDQPFAVDWYISLAGFALKTLGNIREAPKNYGVLLAPKTIRDNLAARRPVEYDQVAAFARWLKSEIDSSWAPQQRTANRALVAVSAILGGRAIGQGQNAGGNEAMLLLRSSIATYAERSGLSTKVGSSEARTSFAHGASAAVSPYLLLGGHLQVFFPTGGNVPDVTFTSIRSGRLLGVGEIKGRKDLSNTWESWMPQVADHMLTWSREFPDSLRLFFGTLITREMIVGESARGTGRTGLKGLHDNGYLQGVYNLSKLALEDDDAQNSFDELMTYFITQS